MFVLISPNIIVEKEKKKFACSHDSSILVKLPNLRKKRPELVEAIWNLSKPEASIKLNTEPCFELGAQVVPAAPCAGDRCIPAAVTQG